jgi:hypothetical protein
MADAYEIDRRDLKLVASFITAACLLVGVAFYFLSKMYFASRAADGFVVTDEHILGVRVAFGVMLACVGVTGWLAAYAPRAMGHGLGVGAAVLALVGGAAAARTDVNFVLPVSLLVTGVLFLMLAWRSLARSRSAWACLVAMSSVFAVVMLFGSTRIRTIVASAMADLMARFQVSGIDLTGGCLYYAMIIPGMLAVATVALALVRHEYRER